jgi:hypothetical protein
MKKVAIILLIIFAFQCSPIVGEREDRIIYIYDADNLFDISRSSNDSISSIFFKTQKSLSSYYDTMLVGENYKNYYLIHYQNYNSYKDTSFMKNISYLDEIKYFDNDWMEDEENLDSLWNQVKCWRCSGIYDTTRIYLILPYKNSDSLQLLQVHRWFYQTQ